VSARGSVFRRCWCRGEDGRELGKNCHRLAADRRHGSWAFAVDLPPLSDGKRRQRYKTGFATRKAAGDALRKVLDAEGRGVDTVEAARLTVGQYLTEWLAGKLSLRRTTARGYAGHVAYLVPRIGHCRMSELRPKHITAAIADIMAATATAPRPVGTSTAHRIRATLRSALTDAVKERLIDFNPAQHAELPTASRPKALEWTEARTAAFWAECERLAEQKAKLGKKPRITFEIWRTVRRSVLRPSTPMVWTAAQLGRFLDSAAQDRLGTMYETIAASGLRRGEACGLAWDYLDLDRAAAVVHEQRVPVGYEVVTGPAKTASGEDRTVEFDQRTVGALLAWRLRQDAERAAWGEAYSDHGLVFCHEDGRPLHPEYVSRHFERLAFKAGLPPIRLHDLRHGHASLMLAADVPIDIVSKRLGHSSRAITSDTYSHLLSGVGRAAAERAAALVPRQAPNMIPSVFLAQEAGAAPPEGTETGNVQVGEAPPGRLELPTLRLTVACSAN
jgi:integrase